MILRWGNMVAILDTEEIWTLYDIHFDSDMKGKCVTKTPVIGDLKSKSDVYWREASETLG